jgi:phospholipid N-methyltransferase
MYLNDYKPTVTQSGVTYIVDYGLGECVYTYQIMGKRIKQEVLQLIKCDMSEVITELNEKSPLNEGDYQDLNMEIRNHSLSYVTEFINGRGPHQQYYSSTT